MTDDLPGRSARPSLRKFGARLAASTMARNTAFLYAVHLSSMAIPLLTIPYIARVLGAGEWGGILFVQSLSIWCSTLIEYGFNLSATRDLAGRRDDASARRRISGDVLSAKIMLAIPATGAYCGALALAPGIDVSPFMACAGLLLALLQGLHPLWFFQAMERLATTSSLELGAKLASMACILLLVRSPGDGPLILWIQVAAQAVSTTIALLLQARSTQGITLGVHRGWETLRGGFSLFLFRASVSLYTSANAFLLGSFSTSRQVAYFGGSEKIAKAAYALLMPIYQSIYPRINVLLEQSPAKANRLAALAFAGTQSLAWCGWAILYWGAPTIIRTMLGPGYAPAVDVLRNLSFLVPIIAASNIFGVQFLLPRRMDRAFSTVIICSGLLNILLSALLAPRFGARGMSWAVIASESVVTGSMGVLVLLRLRQESIAR